MPFLYILRIVVRNLNFNLAIFPDQGFQGKIGGNAGSNNKQTNVEERGEWSFSDSERKIEILEDIYVRSHVHGRSQSVNPP
jgi:hypothetical protein